MAYEIGDIVETDLHVVYGDKFGDKFLIYGIIDSCCGMYKIITDYGKLTRYRDEIELVTDPSIRHKVLLKNSGNLFS